MKRTELWPLAILLLICLFLAPATQAQNGKAGASMKLNKLEYLEYEGVNIMLAHDFYPGKPGSRFLPLLPVKTRLSGEKPAIDRIKEAPAYTAGALKI